MLKPSMPHRIRSSVFGLMRSSVLVHLSGMFGKGGGLPGTVLICFDGHSAIQLKSAMQRSWTSAPSDL